MGTEYITSIHTFSHQYIWKLSPLTEYNASSFVIVDSEEKEVNGFATLAGPSQLDADKQQR